MIEPGVLIFHPEHVHLHENVYVGHGTMLKAYYRNQLVVGSNTWIGQMCFMHAAGGITIGERVGIGPCVRIITSFHTEEGRDVPILFSEIEFAPVSIGDDSDIGVGAIILPGVRIGRGVQIGAGAVVTTNVPDYEVWAGVPAKRLRSR
jgi:acetyltransferase-like isoleucine patch superfamily enzyme